MVKVLVLEVLASLSVPIQLPTVQPVAGAAVREIFSPATYIPVLQFADFSGEAVGLLPFPLLDKVRE